MDPELYTSFLNGESNTEVLITNNLIYLIFHKLSLNLLYYLQKTEKTFFKIKVFS